MKTRDILRRKFLYSGATALGIGLAGCTDQQNTTEPDRDPDSSSDQSTETDLEDTDVFGESDGSETEAEESGPDLDYLHGITGQTYPDDLDGEGYYSRRYEWDALGYEWWFEQEIPRTLEEYYEKRYSRGRNYDIYVSDAYSDPYVKQITNTFNKFKTENDLSESEVVDLAVSFVQSLKYTRDDVTSEFDQYSFYPAETLVEQGGDCEDSAILLAAILREMGYGVVLLYLPDTEPAHMALGVKGDPSIPGTYYEFNGDPYYYVETTGTGWRIGEMPEFDGSTNAEILAIEQFPTLLYYYETHVDQQGVVEVDVTLFTEGETTASQANFYAEFESRSESIVANDEVTFIGSIDTDGRTKTLSLEPPRAEDLRLSTGVSTSGDLHAIDNSEWRQPR